MVAGDGTFDGGTVSLDAANTIPSLGILVMSSVTESSCKSLTRNAKLLSWPGHPEGTTPESVLVNGSHVGGGDATPAVW